MSPKPRLGHSSSLHGLMGTFMLNILEKQRYAIQNECIKDNIDRDTTIKSVDYNRCLFMNIFDLPRAQTQNWHAVFKGGSTSPKPTINDPNKQTVLFREQILSWGVVHDFLSDSQSHHGLCRHWSHQWCADAGRFGLRLQFWESVFVLNPNFLPVGALLVLLLILILRGFFCPFWHHCWAIWMGTWCKMDPL